MPLKKKKKKVSKVKVKNKKATKILKNKAKVIKRKPLKTALKAPKAPKEKIIGEIIHYFPKVRAAVTKLKMPLTTGQSVKIKGHTTDLTQIITSMQIDHVPINLAKKGQEIGFIVNSRVRNGDKIIAC